MIPTINKPTRVTKKTATAIDHIITNSFVENTFKTAIIKTDVSDHFPICIFFPSTNLFTKNDVIYQYKRTINDKKIEAFLQNLYQYDWDTIKTHQDANEAYNNFISTFCTIYDTFFPMNKMKIKTKDLESPWITKGIKKSSKKKQRLYLKFLKKRNEKTKKEYQDYKKLFESIKKRSKKLYFSKLILKYKNNIKKTWQVIKEAIGKEKYKQQNLPKKILVEKKSIIETESIAESFNNFFSEIGPKWAKDIVTSTKIFNEYIKKYDTAHPEKVISLNELQDSFFSLKINKSAGYDDISFNVVKKCFGALHKPLLHNLIFLYKLEFFQTNLRLLGLHHYLK